MEAVFLILSSWFQGLSINNWAPRNNADSQNAESRNAESQNAESQNAKSQNTKSQNAKSQNADSQNAESQNAEKILKTSNSFDPFRQHPLRRNKVSTAGVM
jgi:hypothetical protein